MKQIAIVVGQLGVNCYIVWDETTMRGMVIDPGGDAERVAGYLAEQKLTDFIIVNTHCHADHIGALDELRRLTGAKFFVHADEAPLLADAKLNLSAYMGDPFTARPADGFLADGQKLAIGALSFAVLHTPGHSPGGICLYGEGVLFSGDTLFAGSVGRTDFPGSSVVELGKSIREKLLPLPDDTKVFPGHGLNSTIAEERQYNPFFR